jgi:5'(3')-deoxyribonucleotidase
LKIAIDIDDTICDTVTQLIEYINERIPVNLKMEDIQTYWIEDCIPDQFKWIVDDCYHNSRFWKRVGVLPAAQEYIEKLYNDGHEIYFATATTADNFRKKIKFLERYLTFFPTGYIEQNSICIRNKQLLSVDYLIDDSLSNLTGKRRYFSICLDYPWNRSDYYDAGGFFRAKDWKEIYEFISTHAWT